jgi:hypothetical protein
MNTTSYTLQADLSFDRQVIIILVDWSDSWYLNRVQPNEPDTITP